MKNTNLFGANKLLHTIPIFYKGEHKGGYVL